MAYISSTHAVSLESNAGDAGDVTQNIVEDLYQELGGEVPWTDVEQAVYAEAAEFNDATVTQYLALFIRRGAKERLRVSAN
ncbi:MAG: hypothetical protein U0822_15275 [Anaerolineae bacterium]